MKPLFTLALLLSLSLALPAGAKPKPKPKTSTATQLAALHIQVKQLTQERDQLKEKLAASEGMETEIAATQRSRDVFKAEAESLKKELERLRASMSENQTGSDAILQDLRQAKETAKAAQEENAQLKKDLADAKAKLLAPVAEGTLVTLGPGVTPAKAVNLLRVTPSRKKVERGVVVVNVLISEAGEVLDARLLQGYPKEGEWELKAHEACLEAAKRLVFDPARAQDGTKVRVWQGVGFFLD